MHIVLLTTDIKYRQVNVEANQKVTRAFTKPHRCVQTNTFTHNHKHTHTSPTHSAFVAP